MDAQKQIAGTNWCGSCSIVLPCASLVRPSAPRAHGGSHAAQMHGSWRLLGLRHLVKQEEIYPPGLLVLFICLLVPSVGRPQAVMGWGVMETHKKPGSQSGTNQGA